VKTTYWGTYDLQSSPNIIWMM